MNFENGLFCDHSSRLLYKINKFKSLLNEIDSKSTINETLRTDESTKMVHLEYRSSLFVPVMFILLGLTLLPVQYHTQNFNFQLLKMKDSCSDSTALIFNTLTENQTLLLNTLFPFGVSNVFRLENFADDFKILEELHKRKSLNNVTIKYLSQSECTEKNYTKYINMITVGTNLPKKESDHFILLTTSSPVKKQLFYQIPYSNIILICDDELYRKSLINTARLIKPGDEYEVFNDAFNYDLPDYQSNVLVQWNISCENFDSSTVTISYAQMSFLSGRIFGAIFLSILADYFGRKNIYLTTLYASGIIGSLISMVQSYRQFLVIRFMIAALIQGCFIVSYVLLFETIIKTKQRNLFCIIFVSLESFLNICIGLMTKSIRDWRYLQLVGSLFAAIAFVYPWMIKESFKWLIIKGNTKKAEMVCKKIFLNLDYPHFHFSQFKSIDYTKKTNQVKEILILQPTLKRIISFFVLIWSLTSLINFFINQENFSFSDDKINSDICLSLIMGVFNIILGIITLNLGKRVPLSACIFLGSSFYLGASLLNNKEPSSEITKLIFNIFSKVMYSCSTNILMLFVCELFPCEIRCSSFSFFLSIKHLSEMLSIYVFKINLVPVTAAKIIISLFCVIACVVPILLPEQSSFSFNLDDTDENKENNNNMSTMTSKSQFTNTLDSNKFIININEMKPHDVIIEQQENNYKLSSCDDGSFDEDIDFEANMLAKDIIEKINSENRSKTGKLNPLYEEDQIFTKKKMNVSDRIYDLDSRESYDDNDFNDILARKLFLIQQGSTKF